MAVSMNAGGYMRSDFFISDAAIPMRMEELDAEEMVKFAELISGLDGAAKAPAVPKEQAAGQAQETEVQLPENVQQLAEKIAEGELELESLPKELVTKELLKAVAALKKHTPEKEEQKIGAEITPEVAEQAAQLAAFVPTEIPDDKTAELSEIAAVVAVESADEVASVVKEFTDEEEIPADIPKQSVAESAVPESAVPERAEEPKRFTEIRQEKSAQIPVTRQETAQVSENTAAKPESVVPEQAAQQTAVPTEQPNVPEKLTAEQIEVLNRAAENGEISTPEVKPAKSGKPERRETPVATKTRGKTEESEKPDSAPDIRPTNVMTDRVKSAAEELEMLRNAKANPKQNQPAQEADVTAKPETKAPERSEQPIKVSEEFGKELSAKAEQPEKQPEAESAAQQLAPDLPVVITRKNGEEVEVKPSGIIAQATAKLVDTAKEMTEDKTEYSLVLNPEELGRITVKLAKAEDGTVSVTIAAENARTQRILEQHSEVMQSDLRNSGLRLESWQVVNDAQQDNQAQDYNGSSKNPYHREETPNRSDDAEETSFADIMAAM